MSYTATLGLRAGDDQVSITVAGDSILAMDYDAARWLLEQLDAMVGQEEREREGRIA